MVNGKYFTILITFYLQINIWKWENIFQKNILLKNKQSVNKGYKTNCFQILPWLFNFE